MKSLILKNINNVNFKIKNVWTLVFLIPLSILIIIPENFNSILTFALKALMGTIPFILFAVSLVAYLKATGAESLVSKAFKGNEVRTIFIATLVGGLAPFCSCEVIPFIASMLALGVPLSAVMAFWLSSPLIDPPALLITASSLGWDYAIAKTISALTIGLIGGFGIYFLAKLGMFTSPLKEQNRSSSGSCCDTKDPFNQELVLKFWNNSERTKVFRDEFKTNGLFLLKWLSLAYLIEALMVQFMSAQIIGSFLSGDGLSSIVIGAFIGVPAYLNSYAAPAIVSGLIEQGLSAGGAMAFLVGGAISSIPAMTAVWSLVNRSTFIAYLTFGLGGAILCGLLFQFYINL
ncbi:MAG: permease [Flavobacteriaceae bacterium]|nr:permease [Flavobacteriaceae bacterium]